MRAFWLMLAFVLLVLVDLTALPIAVLSVYAGAILTPRGHPQSVLPSIAFVAVLGAGLIWLTVAVGKAARRSASSRG